MNLPFFIARRYLLRQKGAFSSFIIRLAILATAISVAVMILAVTFITGFEYTIREKLFSFLGHIHVEEYNNNPFKMDSYQPMKEDAQLLQHLRQLPHVQQVSPFIIRPTIIQAHGQMEGRQLKGINSSYRFSEQIPFTGHKIDFSDTAYSRQIQISQNTADRLNISAGDSVQLYFMEAGAAFPRIRKVQVAGIFHTGMEEVDKIYAVCDMRLLQHINNWQPNQINGYQLDLDNEKYADSLSDYIFKNTLDRRSSLTTYTMRDIFPNIFDWLSLQDINGRIILAIMGTVAVINLAVALMILMVEQARMVGVLKAQGMPQSGIRSIFLYHAALIATVGIVAGNILALGIAWLQQKTGFLKLSEDTYYMKQVPVRLYWWQLASIDVATLVLCVLCMWLPTLYISRIQPARVLQFK